MPTHLVRVGECMCVCVFAAAVQGCSKHAGKPVTANQAEGNHPSAQRREPTIPHFLYLLSFLHYSLNLFLFCVTLVCTTLLLQCVYSFLEMSMCWNEMKRGVEGLENPTSVPPVVAGNHSFCFYYYTKSWGGKYQFFNN